MDVSLDRSEKRGAGHWARASWHFKCALGLVGLFATACVAPPREQVESLPDAPYPSCGDGVTETRTLFDRELRAGPIMRESSVIE